MSSGPRAKKSSSSNKLNQTCEHFLFGSKKKKKRVWRITNLFLRCPNSCWSVPPLPSPHLSQTHFKGNRSPTALFSRLHGNSGTLGSPAFLFCILRLLIMGLNETGREQWRGRQRGERESGEGRKRERGGHNKNIGNAFIMTSLLFPTLVIFLGSPQHPFIGIKLALGNLQRPEWPFCWGTVGCF